MDDGDYLLAFGLKLVVLALCVILAGCGGRPPDLIGIDNEQKPVSSVSGTSLHKVFVATSRQPSSQLGELYSRSRSENLGLASVVVSVPPAHVIAELERPRNLPPDPSEEFAVIDPVVYQSDSAFVSSINRELIKRLPSDRSILVFVHGYNTTLSDGVVELAQFVQDSGFKGVPVIFSWASFARQSEYVYDVNSALQARVQLSKSADLLAQTNSNRVDILAWSMGSLVTMEGIVYASARGEFNRNGRLKSVILASPDIDLDLFRAQLKLIQEDIPDIYVLTSEDDYALRVSRWIAGGQGRLGQAEMDELAGLGVSVIDLSDVDDVASNSHGKFAESPLVVQVIGRGLQDNRTLGEEASNTLVPPVISIRGLTSGPES